MFSNILIYFVVIPLLMLAGLAFCRNIRQIRAVAVTGSLVLTALSVYLLVDYLGLRAAGADALYRQLGMVQAVEHQPVGRCRWHIGGHVAPVVHNSAHRQLRFMED